MAPKTRPRLHEMTQELYQSVIDTTVGSIKSVFIEQGISEDVLRELRALWENNVSRSGAIGEYVGAVKAEEVVVGSGTPLGASMPPKIVQPCREPEQPLKIEESIKVEELTDDTKTTNSGKRKLEGAEGDKPEAKMEKKPRQEKECTIADANGEANADGEAADEELLGSDLDDSEIGELDDVAGQDAAGQVDENNSANMVLGAFSKVSRSKNRWRVMLSGCVASIGGKDFLFKKLGLDLEWA